MEQKVPRALLLSVGYGEGHHAAARATAEELSARGWVVQQMDSCAASYPRLFRLSQLFYLFCVRWAPWLWGVAYAQTDTADWSKAVQRPPLLGCCRYLAERIREFQPDVIICTYPLFAYMVDWLRGRGQVLPPCVVVVTDSLEISRPWMLSQASLFCLPDEYSATMVQERYALQEHRVAVSGFPVRQAFRRNRRRPSPSADTLHIVYGGYAPLRRIVADVEAILTLFPRAHITLLAGERLQRLQGALQEGIRGGAIELLERVDDMPALFSRAHIYIGKAGAATMYEAYSAELPCIVNYALPGQEQGNLALLLKDGAGVYVQSTDELLQVLGSMLRHQAAGWEAHVAAIRRAGRNHGAERLVNIIEELLQHEKN